LNRRFGTSRALALSIAAMALLASCASSTSHVKTATSGAIVTYAEAAGGNPNYIFPLEPGSRFSISNYSQFTTIMYPPIYRFGVDGKPILNSGTSLANAPVFSNGDTVATVNLKHWVWSNGQPITARDIVFWMNLLSAVTDPSAPVIGSSSAPGPGWGEAVPGGFPENVVQYQQTGTYTIRYVLNASYNPTWFTYNELSQITPIPQAVWDKLSTAGAVGAYDASAEARQAVPNTSPAEYVPIHPGTADSGALGVAEYLNLQSQDLATYTTNPLWQVVNGPFKLSQFTSSGFVKMIPNSDYSGSPKPRISAFEELPFTSDTSEFSSIESGSVTIGYLPLEDIGQRASLAKRFNYSFNPWDTFSTSDWNYNFTNSINGTIIKQLYFRQAVQSLVDQNAYIKEFQGGFGVPTNGPVPTYPPNNQFLSPLMKRGLLYPFDPSKAVSLLRSNGWTVVPGGESYCSKPGTAAGECGAGVTAGAKATFTAIYASGDAVLASEMQDFASEEDKVAGIEWTLHPESAGLMASEVSGCAAASPCNTWDLENFGGSGWVYGVDPYPTGEELFACGANSNLGGYCSSRANSLIHASLTSSAADALPSLYTYEDYIAAQLPLVNWPSAFTQETVYKSDLHGLLPQNLYEQLTPQYYYFKA